MSYKFERPVGAAADARELEYVAALHQTDDMEDDSWMDASIEAKDVKNFLLSRYGIQVTKQEVRDLIFEDMGGGNDEDECIDLTEVVAILLIPYLAKINFHDSNSGDWESFKNQHFQSQFEIDAFQQSAELRKNMHESKKILSDVLQMILTNATNSNAKSQPLTRNLLRRIFKYYGEHDLLQDDDFIDTMIAAAGGRELNANTFLEALTHDIQLYDVLNESRFQTHYEDVFGLVTYDEEHKGRFMAKTNEGDAENGEDDVFDELTTQGNRKVKRIFSFPQIDFLADSFRSKTQYLIMWIAVVLGYFAWFKLVPEWGIQICNEKNEDTFGCLVGNSIVAWFAVMVSMILIVVPSVMLLSLGNNVYTHSKLEIFAAFVAICGLVLTPPLREFEWFIFETHAQPYREGNIIALWHFLRIVSLIIGCSLLFLQLCNIVRFIIPDSRLTNSKLLTSLLRGSSVRSEFGIKQAAIYKVHEMVKNAYELHVIDSDRQSFKVHRIDDDDDDDSKIELTKDPLLNFTRVTEKRQSSGGFFWAWKTFLSGSLIEKEGIWLHTKLLAGNLAQILVTLGSVLVLTLIVKQIESDILGSIEEGANATESTNENLAYIEDCISIFDPSNCYFPEVNDTSLGIGLCTEVFLPNTTCLSNFVVTSGATYDDFCDIFLDAADQLPAPASLYFDDQCPVLYMPQRSLYSVTPDSVDELYCSAALGVCTAPEVTGDGLSFDACMLGSSWRFPAPFQFEGPTCQNYTELETLLETRENIVEEISEYWPPKVWMFNASLAAGIVGILLVGSLTVMSMIPSMIITTMKFRSGEIASLRDPYFKKYRRGLLATTFLLGASFWGPLVSSVVIFFILYVITFLSVFQVTSPYILRFLSLLIGVTVTLTVKIILSSFLNNYNFVGFYRKHPLVANISSLCFECWHLAVTSSYIVMRVVKLFIIIIIYVGRYDTPVLAQGVGEIGPIKLDAFPFIFRQDLLAMDAHRHPYLERLGMMYIMKLKHGDEFARKAGSIWRLLFVFALFPWLRQYRILNEGQVTVEEELNDNDLMSKSSQFKEKIAALNAKVKLLTAMNKNLSRK